MTGVQTCALPIFAAWRKAADAVFERRAFKEAENAYRQALGILKTLPESPERDGHEWALMNRFAQVLQVTQGWAAPEAAAAAQRARLAPSALRSAAASGDRRCIPGQWALPAGRDCA